ncbi:DUF3105 domain-containing protein [Bacillus sp. 03113]|uniref:DUF3105 domain-containing protein n=1 Tax=Bacillus sp. 03113 TaxID=2578211 RepID=UPI0011433A96|nr:DUF3105 domain-containing protein [Bacillus sp. 03113]
MKQKQRSHLPFTIGLVLFIVGALVGLKYISDTDKSQGKEFLNQHVELKVNTFPEEGRVHTENHVNYKTFPPTSGDHSENPANYGFYEQPIPFENLVHSLEHGDIVIYYNSSVNEKELKALKEISEITYKGSGIEVVPNDEITTPIVLTAWTKMLELPSLDTKKIKQFIYEFIYEGPEKL